MHEMGIAMSIVEIVEESIPEAMRDRAVEAVVVDIGRLSTVIPENLRFCFTVAAQDSFCKGAELDITEIPLTLSCRSCFHGWEADEPTFMCPSCDGIDICIETGRELAVRTIRVADEA
jgi:hydrogenase nickel incorporation protein HypA/HybF